MKIGVRVSCLDDRLSFEKEFQKMVDMGIYSCQLSVFNPKHYTKENAERIKAEAEEKGIEISALWAGWTGPCEWNFTAGPDTLGIVPVAYRDRRLQELLMGSEFAQWMGIKNMITHVGFIPENMSDPNFAGVVAALRYLCTIMKRRNQNFLFETGQETPVTLLRTIEAVGTGNLGINLDTANLILYGKANPVDALDVIGKYVMDTHIKDGMYPTCGDKLGKETRIGDGKVDFFNFIKKLHELGYTGPLTIEREIEGEEQIRDIIYAKAYLEDIKERLQIN